MTEPATTGDAPPQASTGQPAADGQTPAGVPQGAAAPPANAQPQAGDAGKGAGEAGEQKPQDDGAKAPEAYELKAPEGVELDKDAVSEFTTLAKELKLSGEHAQKLADIAVKMQQRHAEAHANTVREWEAASRADKEFGGDAFDTNVAVARKAIDAFGSAELKNLLNSTGLGNHPEVLRAFYKAGKAISETSFVSSGGRAPTGVRDPAKSLYPNMN